MRALSGTVLGAARPVLRIVGHPGETFTFERFCWEVEGPAVGIDGCVEGPSQWSANGTHLSLNHHEGSLRLFTRATCGQARLMVAHGLWDRLARQGAPGADIHVNDFDPDVCTTVYVLGCPDRLDDPAVERFVAAEDIIDATAGFWCPPWVDGELLAGMAWTFQPWLEARALGTPADSVGLCLVIEEVLARIEAHVSGKGGRVEAWGDYDVLTQSGGVVGLVEHGPYARMAIRRAGIRCVAAERVDPAGRRHATLAKSAPFGAPDLHCAYARLNEAERCPERDRWGGSDLVGGSPRGAGTNLTLEEIVGIVASC